MNHFVAFPLLLPMLDARLDASPPPEGLRRFAAEDRHVTVAFLGPCGLERAQAAWRVMASLPLPTFEVELGAVVPMGNPRRYSALAALVIGSERFTAWSVRARDLALRAAELPTDKLASARRPPHRPACREPSARRLPAGETTSLVASRGKGWRRPHDEPQETRALRPHATLARPTRRADESKRAAGLAWARALDVRGLPARLDRLALYGWSADRARRLFAIEAERASE